MQSASNDDDEVHFWNFSITTMTKIDGELSAVAPAPLGKEGMCPPLSEMSGHGGTIRQQTVNHNNATTTE